MDRIDKKILYLLSINARLSNTSIAKHLKTSREVVSYRIKRMQESGILHGFLTLINSQALGKKVVAVGIKVHASMSTDQLAEEMKKKKEIISIQHCSGMFDLIFTLQDDSDNAAYAILHKMLGEFSNRIKQYEVFFKLEQDFSPLGLFMQDEKDKIFLQQIRESKGSAFQNAFNNRKIVTKILIDELDIKILQELNHNARIPLTDLSTVTGISTFQLQNRIHKLIQQNIIQGFIPYVSLASCGFQFYFVFVNIKASSEEKFKSWVTENPNIIWRNKYLGPYNYKLSFFVKNNNQLSDILKEMYSEFQEDILQTESLPVFTSHKYSSFV